MPRKYSAAVITTIVLLLKGVFLLLFLQVSRKQKASLTTPGMTNPVVTSLSELTPDESQQYSGTSTSERATLPWIVYIVGVDQGLKTRIILDWRPREAPLEENRPVAIYSGSCENLGEVRYELHPFLQGRSQSDTVLRNISLNEFWSNLPMALVISKSADEPEPLARLAAKPLASRRSRGKPLACGDLKIPK